MENTILSFPDRGKQYGQSSYRGNCSGYIQKSLFEQYGSKEVTDPMSGSGTTMDVAIEMGLKHHCYDLNSNPRPGIIGSFNAMTDEVPDEARASDTWFWHPPYSSVIGIPYAGKEWDDKHFQMQNGYDPKQFDLGRMDWPEFVKALQQITMKFYSAMDTGARMCVLMGDIKRKGKLHSMLLEMPIPGLLEQIIIKTQHNCVSDRSSYSNKNFVAIAHEYILVLKKTSPYILDFTVPTKVSLDMRNAKMVTWTDVVCAAFQSIKQKKGTKVASLQELYNEINGYERCKTNQNWQEKIRQVVREKESIFKPVDRGVYQCVV